jgi:hypothetical protein
MPIFLNDIIESVVTGVPKSPVKSLTLPFPAANESLTLFYATDPLAVDKIITVVRGTAPSVTFNVRYGTNRNDVGAIILGTTTVTSQTGLYTTTGFTNPTIPAESWVWVNTTAASAGTVEFHITVQFQ